jgi:hypothetical protein
MIISKKLKVEKNNTLSKITYRKRDIWWFFQWLKVALDLDNKFIEFYQSKALGGREGSQKKRSIIKYKIKVIAWKQINLKEIKSMKPILIMTENEKFNYLNKMFIKYRHLFDDFTLKFIKSINDLVEDPNYFIVQIPLSKNRIEIDAELAKLREINKIPISKKKSVIKFYRPVKQDEMGKMWRVWSMKNKKHEWAGKLKMLNNSEIAKKLKYSGFRSVQATYVSVKRMILNIAKGEFPKNRI